MRAFASILLLHFIGITFAPGWIVADFWLEQDRIARELCVQRMVPEETRVCHGECHLKKQLEPASEDREQNLPEELRALRITEMIAEWKGVIIPEQGAGSEIHWNAPTAGLADGHPDEMAPVPWA